MAVHEQAPFSNPTPQELRAQMNDAARQNEFESNKLAKRLRRNVGQAIVDFNMIGQGDRVMVCLSGGKDSYGLLDVLLALQPKAPVDFEIIAFNLDQRHPGFPEHILPDYLKARGLNYHIEVQDTYSIVKRVIPEGKTMCSLCSRLRRGVIYRVASELGATKIALGHHKSDILETFFLNLFFGAKLKAMPPKLVSDDGKHVVIRPLAYVDEEDLEAYAKQREFPIIPCDLCGSQDNLQRKQVKNMMRDWEKKFPGRMETMFRALQDIRQRCSNGRCRYGRRQGVRWRFVQRALRDASTGRAGCVDREEVAERFILLHWFVID
jgi:tRNA 2-thiocytidine biosynthesis protein TtcA